jgi:hypothetical protein
MTDTGRAGHSCPLVSVGELYYVACIAADGALHSFAIRAARIVNVTARRVYFEYGNDVPTADRGRPRILDRQILEDTGRDALPEHWLAPHRVLYTTRAAAGAACERQAEAERRRARPKRRASPGTVRPL